MHETAKRTLHLPLRASRRPSSVNAAFRSSGLLPWRTTQILTLVARSGWSRIREGSEGRAPKSAAPARYARPCLSLVPSCESFVFGAKIREAFLLGKVPGEWLSLALIKDALRRSGRLLEVPVAEVVNRRAQEQAFPITERKMPALECFERQLYGKLGL
jgi:hypothetical protein